MRAFGTITRLASWVVGCALALGVTSPASAFVVNFISAHAGPDTGGVENTTPITGNGPFTATATSGVDSSTGTATVSAGGLTLTTLQNNTGIPILGPTLVPFLGSDDNVKLQWLVTPGANMTFNLSGTYTTVVTPISFSDPNIAFSSTVGTGVSSEMKAKLVDLAGPTLFDQTKTGVDSSALTLDAQSGTLLAGHSYVLTLSTAMFINQAIDPTATGNITFALAPAGPGPGVTVPLPRGAWAGIVMMVTAAGVVAARRRAAMG